MIKNGDQIGIGSSRFSTTSAKATWTILLSIALVAIVWIVFGQTRGYGFVNYDDDDYVRSNPKIVQGLTSGSVRWAFTHVHAANWHPLTTISHMLDCQFYGLNPAGHHLTNVALHAIAAVLLFLALRRLTGALLPSAFVAALFAIHPQRVESVAWIAERKDVLSGVFCMLTLWAYANYAQSRGRALGRYFLALAFFALGLMSKPTLVPLPFVLLLLDYWPLARYKIESPSGRPWRALVVEKLPFLVLSAASCVATVVAQAQILNEVSVPFSYRIGNALVSYVAYLRQLFWPMRLAVLYPYPANGISGWSVTLAVVVLVLISAGAFLSRRQSPWFLVGWLWFLGMLVPVIGLVQVGSQARADRYTYLPHIGLYLVIIWSATALLKRAPRTRALAAGASCAVLVALILCARAQAAVWHDSESLWRDCLAATSDNYIACNNLGLTLLDKGQLAEAFSCVQKALTINPNYAQGHNSLGNAFAQTGKLDPAIAHYRTAIELKPRYVQAYNNLGNALSQKGEFDEGIAEYRKALELQPDYAEVHYNLGNAFMQKGDLTSAMAEFEDVIRINPDYVEAHNNPGSVLLQKAKLAKRSKP